MCWPCARTNLMKCFGPEHEDFMTGHNCSCPTITHALNLIFANFNFQLFVSLDVSFTKTLRLHNIQQFKMTENTCACSRRQAPISNATFVLNLEYFALPTYIQQLVTIKSRSCDDLITEQILRGIPSTIEMSPTVKLRAFWH